jgi:hypothetical protein
LFRGVIVSWTGSAGGVVFVDVRSSCLSLSRPGSDASLLLHALAANTTNPSSAATTNRPLGARQVHPAI